MSNMSYCRFENTARDLDDCQEALEELIGGEAKPLSRTELEAAKRLARTCIAIVGLIAETYECDADELLDHDGRADHVIDAANTAATREEEEG